MPNNKIKCLSVFFSVVGIVFLILSISLFAYDCNRTTKAENFVNEKLSRVESAIVLDEKVKEMPVVEIDGYQYIGYLTIPKFNQKLPIFAGWNNEQLNLAPCRHSGSTKTDNLVIAGHNFPAHFANIINLSVNDILMFQDMAGEISYYEVRETTTVKPSEVQKVITGKNDLTLYTCTDSGLERFVVGAERISKNKFDKSIIE